MIFMVMMFDLFVGRADERNNMCLWLSDDVNIVCRKNPTQVYLFICTYTHEGVSLSRTLHESILCWAMDETFSRTVRNLDWVA